MPTEAGHFAGSTVRALSERDEAAEIYVDEAGNPEKPADQLFFDQIREEAVTDTHIQQKRSDHGARVDTASIAEIRDIQKQAAEELGQRIKRTESLDLNQLFERMSDSEIEAVINQGTLPEWFEAAVQGNR